MALRVIASRIGGLPEFVREGRTGLLFEPGDAEGLAAIMQGLLDGRLAVARSGPRMPGPWQTSTRSIAWSTPISQTTTSLLASRQCVGQAAAR